MGVWGWFGIRSDIASILLMAACTTMCILFRFDTNNILIAMSFTYILELNEFVINLFWSIGELEK